MISLWMFCAVFLLSYSTQLQEVLAKKENLEEKLNIDDWPEGTHSVGAVDNWLYSRPNKRLSTVVRDGGGTSWFITPLLTLPNTSYLVINASCSNNPCQLEILGTPDSSVSSTNAEFLQNVTFDTNDSNKATIKKSFLYLRILARATSPNKFFIYSIKMHHYFCKKRTVYSTDLGQVDSSTTNISRLVVCQNNAVASDGKSKNITIKCTPKGSWTFGDQKCVCDKGFYFNNQGCSCCLIDHYKSNTGDESCKDCPDGKTNNTMHTNCDQCKENHYIGNDEDGPCYVVPSEVKDLKIKQILPKTSVNLTWRRPRNDGGFNGPLTYTVECYLCTNETKCTTAKNATFSLTTTYVAVSNLILNQTYKCKVFSMSSLKNVPRDEWKFSEKRFTVTDKIITQTVITTRGNPNDPNTGSSEGNGTNFFIYVAAGAGFVVIVLLIILIITFRYRRRHLLLENQHQVAIELPDIGQKLYVDPSIYDSPEEALKEFTSELDPSVLELEILIGGGEFGNVYKGTMKCNEGKSMAVAVKTLKADHLAKNENDFLLEASVMGQFNDLNVIHLEGVITKSFPRMIVTEYMSNGSLDRFLRLNDEKLTYLQLIGMARGVASGMVYLCAKNFIHRDLAARNILVNDDLLCKVADFGLSRFVETEGSDGEHSISGGKIPVRWTAPEVIRYHKYSFSGDVWSYGILLWEIMSFGEKPYWEWENHEIIKEVEKGFRLPAPKDCPRAVHNLMLSCWKANRSERPKFEHIRQVLNGWITSPKTIVEDSKDSGIGDWLHSIKMGEYRSTFLNADYESPCQLVGIGDKDLLKIGVRLIGHRKTILKAIKVVNASKDEIQMTLTRPESNQVQSSQSDI